LHTISCIFGCLHKLVRADLATVQEGLSTFAERHLPKDMGAAMSTVLPRPAIMSAAA
jgi:hypothetical protein